MSIFRIIWFISFLLLSQSAISQCPVLTVPDDMTICDPAFISLDGNIAGDYLYFQWQGSNGYSNSNQLSPSVFTSETTTYTLTAYSLIGMNLIFNGDFELGDTGFTSDYMSVGPGSPNCYGAGFVDCEGTYSILNDPSDGHTDFAACGDHTTGSGNMMVVNGAPNFQEIWCQEINVMAGQIYIFHAWATSVHPSAPAILQFSIDGNLIGNNFNLSGATCQWQEFNEVWESPSSGLVEICITNQNTALGGNDFAIDDISFFETCEEKDSFVVTINEFELSYDTPDELSCDLDEVEITTGVSPAGNYDFDWSTLNGVIESSTIAPDIFVSAAGEYTLVVTDEDGCQEEITISVGENMEAPDVDIVGPDELDCANPSIELEVLINVSNPIISWTDEDGNILGNEFFIEINEAGTYTVTVIDPFNGCSDFASYQVIASPDLPTINIEQSNPIGCQYSSTYLTSESSEDVFNYVWYLDGNIIYQGSDQDSILIDLPGQYLLETEFFTGCVAQDFIDINIEISSIKPVFNTPIVNCSQIEFALFLEPNSGVQQISWTDSTGTVTQGDTILISQGGTYNVMVIDTLGCSQSHEIEIMEDFAEPQVDSPDGIITCANQFAIIYPIITSDYDTSYWTTPTGDLMYTDTLEVTEVGNYILTVVGLNGCIAHATAEIILDDNFPETILEATNISCNNPIAHISSTITSNTSYVISWSYNGSVISNESDFMSTDPGIYHFELTTSDGCVVQDSVEVKSFLGAPNIDLIYTSDTLNCATPDLLFTVDTEMLSEVQWILPNNDVIVDEEINITSPGIYSVAVVDAGGCTDTLMFEIFQDLIPPVFGISSDTIDCNHPLAEFFVDNPDGHTITILDEIYDPELAPWLLPEGTHEFIAEAANGCRDTIYYTFPQDTMIPEIEINIGDITCINPDAQLSATQHDEILSYNWFNLNGQIIAQGTNAEISETGSYILIAVGNNGCTETYEFEVSENTTIPDIELEVNEFSCLIDEANMIASYNNDNYVLDWKNLGQSISTADSLILSGSGVYFLNVLDTINGCTYDTIVPISDDRVLIDSIHFTTDFGCGDPEAQLQITEVFGGTPNYSYSINEEISGDTIFSIPNGLSTIQVIDALGCTLDTIVEVQLIEPLILQDWIDQEVIWPAELTLEVETNRTEDEILSLEWIPMDILPCQNCFIQMFRPETALTVQVVVEDIFGCVEEISTRVSLTKDIQIYFPNVFSPNNDSTNESFFVIGNDEQVEKILNLNIYDRWGNLVFLNEDFSLNDAEAGWQGTFSNQNATSGVYTWICSVELVNGEILHFAGDVTLLR